MTFGPSGNDKRVTSTLLREVGLGTEHMYEDDTILVLVSVSTQADVRQKVTVSVSMKCCTIVGISNLTRLRYLTTRVLFSLFEQQKQT